MIAQGFGISLLGGASQLFPTAGVVLLPITDEPEPIAFYAVWLPQNRSAAIRNLLAPFALFTVSPSGGQAWPIECICGRTRAKDGLSDPHDVRAFLDGNLKIT